MIATRWVPLWLLGILLPALTIIGLAAVEEVLGYSGGYMNGPLAWPVFVALETATFAVLLLPGMAICTFIATRIEGSLGLKTFSLVASVFFQVSILFATFVAMGIIALMTSGLSGTQ